MCVLVLSQFKRVQASVVQSDFVWPHQIPTNPAVDPHLAPFNGVDIGNGCAAFINPI